MGLDAWLLFLVTETLLASVPGPAVLFVIGQGLRGGGRAGLAAVLGILLANAIWFLLSALGLGAVLAAAPGLASGLRWAGAIYVGWLGVVALRGGGAIGPARIAASEPFVVVLQRGALLQLANPKALLFFVAILPGFVDASDRAWPAWLQILVFAATSIGSEFWVLLGYAMLASAARMRLQDGRHVRRLDVAAGVVLILVGAWIVLRG